MAAQKWGAGTDQCGAATTMLRKCRALEPTIAALELQLCTGVGTGAQRSGAGTANLRKRGALERLER